MFDISFGELLVIGTVAIVVFGPEKLPKVLREVGYWIGTAKKFISDSKKQINQELNIQQFKEGFEKIQNEVHDLERDVKNYAHNFMGHEYLSDELKIKTTYKIKNFKRLKSKNINGNVKNNLPGKLRKKKKIKVIFLFFYAKNISLFF